MSSAPVLRHALFVLLAFGLALGLAPPATAATFTVTSNADSGAGTLRAAITAANAAAGDDTVAFDLPAGQRTIVLASALPTIAGTVHLDGFSQPGHADAPLVRIDGIALPAGTTALRIAGGTCTVRGLMITRAPGIGLLVDGGFGHQIYGNYFGTDGTAALGNVKGLQLGGSVSLVSVGQAVPGRHNVLSGNVDTGLLLSAGTSFNQVLNNRIGTNAAGDAAVPNGYAGIRNFGTSNTFGSSADAAMNVISGNERFGIESDGVSTAFYGNRIGTNAAGTAAIGNGETGLDDSGIDSQIGGVVAGAGNLVSGNGSTGISLSGTGTTVVGNRIGTNAAGTAAIGNGYVGVRVFASDVAIGESGIGNLVSGNIRYGIELDDNASLVRIRHNRIGTDHTGNQAIPNLDDGINLEGTDVEIGGLDAGNLISGNDGSGISVASGSHGLRILANRIGTRADGMAALPNTQYAVRAIGGTGLVLGAPGLGNVLSGNARGVVLQSDAGPALVQSNIIGLSVDQSLGLGNDETGLSLQSGGHTIGGEGVDEGNVIADNRSSGVRLDDGAVGNVISGNTIGSDAAGNVVYGNGYADVYVYRARDNFIGGATAAAGNTLRGSSFGVYVELGTGNTIVSNRIEDHDRAGIELEPHGPEADDPLDADFGPNLSQNRPLVNRAEVDGNNVSMTVTLHAAPSTEYLFQAFHAETCHASGIGEGRHLLGTGQSTTTESGNVLMGWNLANPHGAGVVTMTATDPAGNTSEFSPCVAIGPTTPGRFSLWHDPLLAYEDRPFVRVHVIRSHGFDGTATVRVKTVNDSATAPSDFAAVDQLLQFGHNQWLHTIDIPLVADGVTEGDESFRVELSDPGQGATLGAQSSVEVLLFDHEDAWPFVSVDDVQATEPTGSGNVTFVVHSSASDHPFDVTYSTFDGSATAGADYVAVSGTLAFGPGIATRTVTVPLLGDGIGEPGESFFLHVTGTAGDFIASDLDGEAVILDDDGGALFRDGFE